MPKIAQSVTVTVQGVVTAAPADARLAAYPRPKGDNGIGIHFRLNVNDKQGLVDQGVQWAQSVNAKWALVAAPDWLQIAVAAKKLWAVGIMPVCRLICKIDHYNDFSAGVKALTAAGVPAYIQIYNEPGDDREWNGKPDVRKFGGSWGVNAAIVFDAGGYPGMGAVLGQGEWLAAFNSVQGNGRMDIWSKTWFCVHNYGSNHPTNYPYDDVNQSGTQLTQADYDKEQWGDSLANVNALRTSSKKPGATAVTDDTCMLRFIEFKSWMVSSLGYSLPMIGGEGGWEWGSLEDRRYPKLSAQSHANNTKAMFQQFSSGKLCNGDPLPDELFSLAPWLMADWGADDWWYGPLGTKQGTIDAVASISSFVRKFGWDWSATVLDQSALTTGDRSSSSLQLALSDKSPGQAAHIEGTPPAPSTDGAATYIVQPGETMSGIARKLGTTVATIAFANRITDTSRIRAGQKLIVPR
jgi:hypothetical protein